MNHNGIMLQHKGQVEMKYVIRQTDWWTLPTDYVSISCTLCKQLPQSSHLSRLYGTFISWMQTYKCLLRHSVPLQCSTQMNTSACLTTCCVTTTNCTERLLQQSQTH